MLENLQVNDYKFHDYINLNDNLLYLDYINLKYNFKEFSVLPNVALRYKGNLFGLFREVGIPEDLYLFTMYINGYVSPTDFDGGRCVFKKAIKPPVPTN